MEAVMVKIILYTDDMDLLAYVSDRIDQYVPGAEVESRHSTGAFRTEVDAPDAEDVQSHVRHLVGLYHGWIQD